MPETPEELYARAAGGLRSPPVHESRDQYAEPSDLHRELACELGVLQARIGRAILFDLDDTLIVDVGAAEAAFAATAAIAAARHVGLDAAALAQAARVRARELWHRGPGYDYCRTIGMSSWEGLWCKFEGEADPLPALRAWAPGYRYETWRLALADQGVDDEALAAELGEAFARERRARHEVFADARIALTALEPSYRLGLITNGAACLQREKLAASELASFFEVTVVSGELGYGKPDPRVFANALQRLGAHAHETVMVGDSVGRDVEGALAAGLGAVWLNRDHRQRSSPPAAALEVSSLCGLSAVLARAN